MGRRVRQPYRLLLRSACHEVQPAGKARRCRGRVEDAVQLFLGRHLRHQGNLPVGWQLGARPDLQRRPGKVVHLSCIVNPHAAFWNGAAPDLSYSTALAAAHLEPPVGPGVAHLMTKASFLRYLEDARLSHQAGHRHAAHWGPATPGVGAVLYPAYQKTNWGSWETASWKERWQVGKGDGKRRAKKVGIGDRLLARCLDNGAKPSLARRPDMNARRQFRLRLRLF